MKSCSAERILELFSAAFVASSYTLSLLDWLLIFALPLVWENLSEIETCCFYKELKAIVRFEGKPF